MTLEDVIDGYEWLKGQKGFELNPYPSWEYILGVVDRTRQPTKHEPQAGGKTKDDFLRYFTRFICEVRIYGDLEKYPKVGKYIDELGDHPDPFSDVSIGNCSAEKAKPTINDKPSKYNSWSDFAHILNG